MPESILTVNNGMSAPSNKRVSRPSKPPVNTIHWTIHSWAQIGTQVLGHQCQYDGCSAETPQSSRLTPLREKAQPQLAVVHSSLELA